MVVPFEYERFHSRLCILHHFITSSRVQWWIRENRKKIRIDERKKEFTFISKCLWFRHFFSFQVSTTNVTRYLWACVRIYSTHRTIIYTSVRSWARRKKRRKTIILLCVHIHVLSVSIFFFFIEINCGKCYLIK
jgi:hypothetical protein